MLAVPRNNEIGTSVREIVYWIRVTRRWQFYGERLSRGAGGSKVVREGRVSRGWRLAGLRNVERSVQRALSVWARSTEQ